MGSRQLKAMIALGHKHWCHDRGIVELLNLHLTKLFKVASQNHEIRHSFHLDVTNAAGMLQHIIFRAGIEKPKIHWTTKGYKYSERVEDVMTAFVGPPRAKVVV